MQTLLAAFECQFEDWVGHAVSQAHVAISSASDALCASDWMSVWRLGWTCCCRSLAVPQAHVANNSASDSLSGSDCLSVWSRLCCTSGDSNWVLCKLVAVAETTTPAGKDATGRLCMLSDAVPLAVDVTLELQVMLQFLLKFDCYVRLSQYIGSWYSTTGCSNREITLCCCSQLGRLLCQSGVLCQLEADSWRRQQCSWVLWHRDVTLCSYLSPWECGYAVVGE